METLTLSKHPSPNISSLKRFKIDLRSSQQRGS